MIRDMLEFHVNKYRREKQIKWWQCFHKNHGWISGFRVAKNHVSRSWAITTFERERQRDVTLRTYCIPFLSKCQSWPHRCIWIFEADFVGDSFKNRLLTPHPVSPKKIHNWKSISSNYIGRIMHFCDFAKRVYKRVLCAFWGGQEYCKKVAYICQITREESKGKVIALVDQPKCERSFSSWNILRWWIVCILELHDRHPPTMHTKSVSCHNSWRSRENSHDKSWRDSFILLLWLLLQHSNSSSWILMQKKKQQIHHHHHHHHQHEREGEKTIQSIMQKFLSHQKLQMLTLIGDEQR